MLHSYIVPSKKSQTSRQKKVTNIPCLNQRLEDMISISALVQQAKNEERDIVSFLKPHITIEEVLI